MDPEDPSTTVGLPCTQQTGSKDLVTRRRVVEDKYKHNRCDVGRGRPSWCCVTQTHTQRERERDTCVAVTTDRFVTTDRQTDRQTWLNALNVCKASSTHLASLHAQPRRCREISHQSPGPDRHRSSCSIHTRTRDHRARCTHRGTGADPELVSRGRSDYVADRKSVV